MMLANEGMFIVGVSLWDGEMLSWRWMWMWLRSRQENKCSTERGRSLSQNSHIKGKRLGVRRCVGESGVYNAEAG